MAQTDDNLLQGTIILDPGGGSLVVSETRKSKSGPGKRGVLRSDVGTMDYSIHCDGKAYWTHIWMETKDGKKLQFERSCKRLIFTINGTRVTDYCEYSEDKACDGAGLPGEFHGEWKKWRVFRVKDSEIEYCGGAPDKSLPVELKHNK